MKLSIIIPFYNVLPYFNELLDSLMSQINDEVEVIFVNDASTDDSVKCLNKYLGVQNVILLENDINRSVSYSRNRAIKLASGEYIWFVDSDDIIPENAINIILNKINSLNRKVDIISTNFCYFEDTTETKNIQEYVFHFDEYPTKDYRYDDKFYIFYDKIKTCSMVFNCIYKRSLLINNSIVFNEKISVGETYLFKVFAFWYAETFDFIYSSIYIYRMNRLDEKSLSKLIPSTETVEESIVEYNVLFDMFYNDYPEGEGRDKMLQLMSGSFLLYVKCIICLEKLYNLQMLYDRNIVDESDYDKFLNYENITWVDLLTDDKYNDF